MRDAARDAVTPVELRARFAALVAAGDRADLGRCALEIARIGYPDLDPAPHLRRLDDLAAAVRPRLAGAPPPEAAARLVGYLFEECGFRGNAEDYYDPRNSFLNDVLERRTGIPISLAVVLIETGSRLDLAVEGVAFPGHFLVRVPGETGPSVRDPFQRGRVVDHRELLARLRTIYAGGGGPAGSDLQRVLPQALQTAPPTAILYRMLANLLRIYLEHSDHLRALAAVDLMLVLQPDGPEDLRVRGLLYEQLECFASALADLECYLALAPASAQAAEVRAHVARLRGIVATLH